jgi:signal transduction histidine kinase
VSTALAVGGWMAAALIAAVALSLARRLELAARAEHELRGPVTVLRLALERLQRDASARRHVSVLEAQLERLCAGLADLSAARDGRRVAAEPAEVDLTRTLLGAVEGWRAVLAPSGRELRVRWQRPPGQVTADPRRLAQALGNLLANSCEHGSGPVELRAVPSDRGLRIELENEVRGPLQRRRRRGRGLKIAAAAARDLDADLLLLRDGDRRVASLELPADDAA